LAAAPERNVEHANCITWRGPDECFRYRERKKQSRRGITREEEDTLRLACRIRPAARAHARYDAGWRTTLAIYASDTRSVNQQEAMPVMLIEGTVSHVERDASSVRFRVGEHQLDVVHQPDLFLLEDGVSVQLLVDGDSASGTLDVLALKCEGHPPIYLGPRMGWWVATVGIVIAMAAVIVRHEWLLLVPGMLCLAQSYFLKRRMRVFEAFTHALAEPRTPPSFTGRSMPPR
jgi:hypothetical protein